jgi:hypothetical protein
MSAFTARWAKEVLAQEGVALTAPFVDLVDTIVEGIEEALLNNAAEVSTRTSTPSMRWRRTSPRRWQNDTHQHPPTRVSC